MARRASKVGWEDLRESGFCAGLFFLAVDSFLCTLLSESGRWMVDEDMQSGGAVSQENHFETIAEACFGSSADPRHLHQQTTLIINT